jgi:di/tricarboxylate transporter
MDWHPWIAVGVTLSVFAALQLRRGAPIDLLFLGGLLAVTLTGVITPSEAFSGFSNTAVLTIGALLAVAAGLRSCGVLDWIGEKLLGSARSERSALPRLAAALAASSAFLLNTALVAMMAPVVVDWCRRRRISPSKLLIPVSYLSILGGVCTLIGTSTTLVVNGKLQAEYAIRAEQLSPEDQALLETSGKDHPESKEVAFARDVEQMSLFELGYVGLPCALAGIGFLLLFGPKLLPNRTDMLEKLGEQRREYLVEMQVAAECPLIGRTVENAGLRHLPGLFLIEIDRNGDIITPVTPDDVIHSADRLVFTGVVNTIVDLEKIPGLVPVADMHYEFRPKERQQRHLTEVVLSRTSPLIGTTVREANFRQRYNAAVVAVHRSGVRLTNKIGNIQLEPGDTLLLQTRNEFVSNYRNSRDFYLVSPVEGSEPRQHHKAKLAASLVLLLIIWLVVATIFRSHLPVGLVSPATAALACVVLMVVTGCLRVSDARNSIDLQMLVTIACALGLGRALDKSGAAGSIAEFIVQGVGENPYLLLVILYLLTVLFTEMITNNAVAAMFFPLAIALAWEGDYSPRPFIIAITLAASTSFITPIGYQTNLMVMGPGGYRPIDYLKCGLPLAVIVTVTGLLLIPRIWPF